MRILGAILAGGRSSRFGSDKAAALWRGKPLIAHVHERLAAQCDEVIEAGRNIPDRPAPGLGPLGGLCGALAYARDHRFDIVLTAPCDAPLYPLDASARLVPAAPSIMNGPERAHPAAGAWPAALAGELEAWLKADKPRAMLAWADAVNAARILFPADLANVNRPEDLAGLS